MEINTPVKVANSGGLSHDCESLRRPNYTYSKFHKLYSKEACNQRMIIYTTDLKS